MAAAEPLDDGSGWHIDEYAWDPELMVRRRARAPCGGPVRADPCAHPTRLRTRTAGGSSGFARRRRRRGLRVTPRGAASGRAADGAGQQAVAQKCGVPGACAAAVLACISARACGRNDRAARAVAARPRAGRAGCAHMGVLAPLLAAAALRPLACASTTRHTCAAHTVTERLASVRGCHSSTSRPLVPVDCAADPPALPPATPARAARAAADASSTRSHACPRCRRCRAAARRCPPTAAARHITRATASASYTCARRVSRSRTAPSSASARHAVALMRGESPHVQSGRAVTRTSARLTRRA
jgi:hypothetical protein